MNSFIDTFYSATRVRIPHGKAFQVGLALAMLTGVPGALHAADWPTRQVTIIVPFIAGGNTDMMGRLAAQGLSSKYGQPFIVENRGGAGGVIGAAEVAKSKPDGYTVLFGAMTQVTLAPMVQKVAYDPDKDLIPITEFGTGPQILGVKADMPVNTLQEFIDYAKARPGKLSYAGVGLQTVTTIAAGMLMHKAGLDMTLVPYKGGIQAVSDLLAGHVDMYFGNASEMLPHKDGGKIKLLAVSTEKRIAQVPNLQTVSEIYPGFVYGSWNGLMVPAGTPRDIVDKIVAGSVEAVNSPSVKEKLIAGAIVPGGTTPEQSLERFKADKALFADAVKTLNIKPE